MSQIPFSKPFVPAESLENFNALLKKEKFCGDGTYTHQCSKLLEEKTLTQKSLLVTSCTHALEMAAILLDITADDEVIMPSYTFVSTANAFLLRGAQIVFVDVDPLTMNISPEKISEAITEKTKAIVVVHYAGVACDMQAIKEIADSKGIFLVEDAAQGLGAYHMGKHLGSIGHLGCYSFHETKNIHCGEGGALLINDERFIERAQIIREKGTNRTQYLMGQVDKYTWVDKGSSYLLSEINACFLLPQIQNLDWVNGERMKVWNAYKNGLQTIADQGKIELPFIPEYAQHNAHMFYLKTANLEERSRLIAHLKQSGISAVFHYIPLHSSPAGVKYTTFFGEDKYTTRDSMRLLRLPLYVGLQDAEVQLIIDEIIKFYKV
jgi:dTDP-4-amino-4,6-dideoxygalactose transaminase